MIQTKNSFNSVFNLNILFVKFCTIELKISHTKIIEIKYIGWEINGWNFQIFFFEFKI